MTAEIAILNRSAVAMAADSAVTMRIGRDLKIFPTANKIFALSAVQPVGIMIYGGADYMNVPWETIIKVLRGRLADRSFSKLADYASWFRDTLADSKDFIVGNATGEYIMQCVGSYFAFLLESTKQRINAYIEENKEIPEDEVASIVHSLVAEHAAQWKGGKLMPGISKKQLPMIRRVLKERVDELIDVFFPKLPTPPTVRKNLHFIAESIFTRESQFQRGADSGVVIAGFGTSEIVPALTSMAIRGSLDGVLQWEQVHELSMEKMQYGVIVPFAQTDEVQSFLDGVHPDYQRRLDQDFQLILDKTTDIILDEVTGPSAVEKQRAKKAATDKIRAQYGAYRKELDKFRREQYSQPILQVLAGTPKDQLASMAEAMVNLTSFKRRVSLQAETVGGPIDVALISKGDGLVWVKRKHYFPQELNHQFFSRYNQGLP